MSRAAAVTAWLLAALLAAGCGYRTAGRAVRIPAEVRTIAVPAFENRTQTYRVEQVLTSAVVREFLARTPYRIVTGGEPADATLRGVVTEAQLTPLTYDSQTGRASSALVLVRLRVQLADRAGNVLFENPDYVFREQYQVSREVSSFFEEEGPAVNRLSREFARTLVSSILEGF